MCIKKIYREIGNSADTVLILKKNLKTHRYGIVRIVKM
jgi:hypothetical protein